MKLNFFNKSPMLGMWSVLRDPDIVEIAGNSGFDFTIIDFEHGPHSISDLSNMVRAGHNSGMLVGVRPSGNFEKEILRCMESNPDGIFIPHIKTAKEAKIAVNSCLYPPFGTRGSSGFTRSSNYGMSQFSTHKDSQNSKIFICILIESLEGLENLTSIIKSCPRIDCIYFGTYDIFC